jgi:hypothetical protein
MMSEDTFKPDLREISLKISDIECRTYKFGNSIGLIKFRGKYRSGENEAHDALWMRWNIDKFCDCEHHYITGLILDLQELEYEGGQELATITDLRNDHLFIMTSSCPPVAYPILIPDISQDKTRYQAFRDILSQEVLVTNIEEALNKIEPLTQIKVEASQFAEIDMTRKTNIVCKAYLWDVPETNQIAGFMQFEGFYKHGSAGTGDAHYLRWIEWLFYDIVKGKLGEGMVFDLTKLDYTWGDELPAYTGGDFTRVVLPESPEQRAGYLSWFRGKENIADTLDQAFKEVKEAVQQKFK